MTYIYRPGSYNVTDSGRARIAQPGGVATPWYRAGGAPAPQVAYQPKGAASLAASYVNLVTPGTYNAYPGTAPAFDAATGWSFTAAASQYLKTDWLVTNTTDRSALLRFSNRTTNGFLFGTITLSGNMYRFGVQGNNGSNIHTYGNAGEGVTTGSVSSGVLGFAGNQGFLNGVPEAVIAGTFTFSTDLMVYIGARNFNNTVNAFQTLIVQAFVIYGTTLTAAQVAAVSAAMAAL